MITAQRPGRSSVDDDVSAAGSVVRPIPEHMPVLRHRLLHVVARRCLNPIVVRLGAGGRFSPVALVLHLGRRSGRRYATPLAVQREDDRLFICLTYGPATRWCLNILAAGGCTVRLKGREYIAVEPRIVARDELPSRLRRRYALVRMSEALSLRIADAPARVAPGAAVDDGVLVANETLR